MINKVAMRKFAAERNVMKKTLAIITLCSVIAPTAVIAGTGAQNYSSKGWLLGNKTAECCGTPPATFFGENSKTVVGRSAGSKGWLESDASQVKAPRSSFMSPVALTDKYNSKLAARGERVSAEPVFQLAPLK